MFELYSVGSVLGQRAVIITSLFIHTFCCGLIFFVHFNILGISNDQPLIDLNISKLSATCKFHNDIHDTVSYIKNHY